MIHVLLQLKLYVLERRFLNLHFQSCNQIDKFTCKYAHIFTTFKPTETFFFQNITSFSNCSNVAIFSCNYMQIKNQILVHNNKYIKY